MNAQNHCPTPECKEDLIDRINKASGELYTKVNALAKCKISKSGAYALTIIAVTILLGVSTILYASYASGRDKRAKMIEMNQKAVNEIQIQQEGIKTKLDVELRHIKEALEENKEISKKVLEMLRKSNGD